MRLDNKVWIAILLLLSAGGAGGYAQETQEPPERRLARGILAELIGIDTTDRSGDNTAAAEAMAARFRAAGFAPEDVQVLGPAPRKGNLVLRWRGTGRSRPVLFLGHLDVVEARREDWSMDPFHLIEKDGYFYGRGTQDIKGDDSLLVADFIRLKREGFTPARDLILALTSDEETGPHNGVEWLLAQHRDLIDAEYSINVDGGGGQSQHGQRQLLAVQTSEKTPLHIRLTVRNKGGHSSLPTRDNAIYRLAEALGRLSRFDFPVRLNETTRAYFRLMSTIEGGALGEAMRAAADGDASAAARISASPTYNALLRTTCVATRLEGGHADNALPQKAAALVNCRMLPDDSADSVERELRAAIADPQVTLEQVSRAVVSPPSDPRHPALDLIRAAAAATWPGVPVVPTMETGASDGKFLRIAGIPTYGVSGMFIDLDDVRAHGQDERIPVDSYYDGLAFHYRLIRAVGSSAP